MPVAVLAEEATPDRIASVQLDATELPAVEIARVAPDHEPIGPAALAATSLALEADATDVTSSSVVASPSPKPAAPIHKARVRRVATAPQLTVLPAGKGGPARIDALPIAVEAPKAVAKPVAKPALPSATADFVTAVDPRRPASQPVSGTVSGLDLDIRSQLVTRIDGRVAGELDFKQTNQALSVRLGSIVELLRDRYDMSEFERITASSASDAYVSMAQLRGAGIPISYDPVYDEFNVGSRDHRPANAHKVQIDQIGSPGQRSSRSGIDQVRP